MKYYWIFSKHGINVDVIPQGQHETAQVYAAAGYRVELR